MDFDKWLGNVINEFKEMSFHQQKKTVQMLMHSCSPTNKYLLLKHIQEEFQKDILTMLPPELQEYVCLFLDAKTLLTACNVSHEWDRLISSMTKVWQTKCKILGTGVPPWEPLPQEWKSECSRAVLVRDGIQTGAAFEERRFITPCLTHGELQPTTLGYCDGILVIGSDKWIEVKSLKNCYTYLMFMVDCTVSCAKFLNPQLILFGHNNGHLTLWELAYVPAEKAALLKVMMSHMAPVLSVDASLEIDLVVSGSVDNNVKLWSLSSGCLLKTLAQQTHWVLDTVLVPAGDERCSKFPDKHFLVCKTKDYIHIYSWKKDCINDNLYGDISDLDQRAQTINVSSTYNFHTPGLQIIDSTVVYVRQTYMPDTDKGNGQLMFVCLDTMKSVRQIDVHFKIRKLLAVGDRFALLLLPWAQDDVFNFVVLDVDTGTTLGGCTVPHSRSTTPGLAQIALGEVKWLDGLVHMKTSDVVVALALDEGFIHTVFWSKNYGHTG